MLARLLQRSCRAAQLARCPAGMPCTSLQRGRGLCAAAKPPSPGGSDADKTAGGGKDGAEPSGVAASDESTAVTLGASQNRAPGGLAVYNEDEDNLPPLKYEEGPVGAAQKGVSAIVIAFGAVAFGACVWGVSQALFPSASSTQAIFTEALDKASIDATVGAALGSPLKAWGAGGSSGRRNAIERWELDEDGVPVTVIRFNVAGPQGTGRVVAQVPQKRKRGEFRYILFEHRRKLVPILDNRTAPPPAEPVPAVASGPPTASTVTTTM